MLKSCLCSPAEQPETSVTLPDKANGKAAIAALERANGLSKVANEYGMTAERLKSLFEKDKNLFVDQSGRLLYVESVPDLTPDAADNAEGAPEASATYTR